MKRLHKRKIICLVLASAMLFGLLTAVSAKDETNLLCGAAVTASSQIDGNAQWAISNLTDGNVTTGGSTGGPRSTPDSTEWFQFELAQPASIGKVVLYPRYAKANRTQNMEVLCFPVDFTIQLSADGEQWTTVITQTDYVKAVDASGQIFEFSSVSNTKYIKIVATKLGYEGNTVDSYRLQLMEVEAYAGQPAAPEKLDLADASVSVSSQISGNTQWAPGNVLDGNLGKGWSSDGPRTTADYHEWITVSLSAPAAVSEIVLVPRFGHGNSNVDQFLCFPQNFTIQTSVDGETWATVVTQTGYTATQKTGEHFTFPTQSNVQYIKVDATRLSHEGNTEPGYRFQIMEFEAYGKYNNSMSLQEIADSIGSLSVDYETEKLILPSFDGIDVAVYSSSAPSVVALDGSVDTVYGGSSYIVLRLTGAGGETADTKPIHVTVRSLLAELAEEALIESTEASSSHQYWGLSHLTDGKIQNDIWSSQQYAGADVNEWVILTLHDAQALCRVDLYPRDMGSVIVFPVDFEIYVSADREQWTSVAKLTNYSTNGKTTVQQFQFVPYENTKYVKIAFTKVSCDEGGQYSAQLAEIKTYSKPNLETAEQAAQKLRVNADGSSLLLENVGTQFRAEVTGVSPDGIILSDNSIVRPAQDTEVTVTVKITNRFDPADIKIQDYPVTIKSEATLALEAIAAAVNLIDCPAPDAGAVTLPTVPAGYRIQIESSDHPEIISTTGAITRSDDTTYGVRLTLRVTDTASGRSVLTKPLLVPIYKTYRIPQMTQAEIDAAHADYESKAYGLFVHYISQYDAWGGCTYTDGTLVKTVDELAAAFNAAQFAKDANDFGVEYIVLTVWHGDTRALFPSMTNERWRDDRRSAEGAKSYADRDVIQDLLDALAPYGIDLYLYTHPCDGHDFTEEDQALTGWNDSGNSYGVWNQYINELYYELCERYGTQIKGLWFDGMYNHIANNGPQQRLKATCLTFNPRMILTMNTGFTEGKLNIASGYTGADYKAWEVNRRVDYVNDMAFSRYQSAIVLAGAGWWADKPKSAQVKSQSAEDLYRYITAMASISTHGGFLNSTGFYPEKSGEDLHGDYWMGNIRDTLVKVNGYLEPVSESIKNTSVGKAWPTTENQFVKDLVWGVSTESRDGRHVYLHLLKKPDGRTFTIGMPADGSEFVTEAQILNFDGTETAISFEETDAGYSLTLPENVQWSDLDTVVRLTRKVAVTDITLDQTALTLTVGQSKTLFATLLPETATAEDIRWSSSAPTVAEVSEAGVVTAVNTGSADIMVSADGKSAVCSVHVLADKTALQGLYLENLTRDPDRYGSGWNMFETALHGAKSVLENETVSQADVDAAYAALTVAIAGLEERTDPPIFPLLPAITGNQGKLLPFKDVSRTDWFYDSVRRAWENGLIDGVTANLYQPDGTLTVAQTIKLAATLHQMGQIGTVTLRNGNPWYQSYLDYAVQMGVIGTEYQTYSAQQLNEPVTRAEFVHIFYGTMAHYTEINDVPTASIPDVSNGVRYAVEIYTFYRAGILTGSDAAGTFHPDSSMKRSEVAAILLRMFDDAARVISK